MIGLEVFDERGRPLGRVERVEPTAGVDLLHVARAAHSAGEDPLLVPMAKEIVLGVDEQAGRITVRLPPGLEELNR